MQGGWQEQGKSLDAARLPLPSFYPCWYQWFLRDLWSWFPALSMLVCMWVYKSQHYFFFNLLANIVAFDRDENLEDRNFLLVSWKQTRYGGELPITGAVKRRGVSLTSLPVLTGTWSHESKALESNLQQSHWPQEQSVSQISAHITPGFFWSTTDRGLHKKQGLVAQRLHEDPQSVGPHRHISSTVSSWTGWGLDAVWVSPFYVSVLSTECKSLHFISLGCDAQSWQSRALHWLEKRKGKEKLNFRVTVVIPLSQPEMLSSAGVKGSYKIGPFVK